MVENANERRAARASRRAVLAGGAATAAITGFPYMSRGFAAQTLKFWQFYAPGGGVATQDKWYRGRRQGLERQPRGQGRARLCSEQRLHGRHEAADRFRLWRGPRSLHHQPGRFPALLQRRRASRSDAVHGAGARATISFRASSPTAWSTARSMAFPTKSSRWRCITASTPSTRSG